MEAPFENYADFCAKMSSKMPLRLKTSFMTAWEELGKNQALFEYFIRDTTQNAIARMEAYKILYHGLHPDKLPIDNYRLGVLHILMPQFDKKMLAKLLYDDFKSSDDFHFWGKPWIFNSRFHRDTAILLGMEMLPYFYKELDNAGKTPHTTSDWRENDYQYSYRYADYANYFLQEALQVDFFHRLYLDYEERFPDIMKMKSYVQAYCAERGISLE